MTSDLLDSFTESGLLGPADVHTATLLGELWAEPDERVRLAAALAVRALRAGSVCVEVPRLAEIVLDAEDAPDTADLPWPDPQAWLAALTTSELVQVGTAPSPGGDQTRPLRLVGDLLYLERYWLQEEAVRGELLARSGASEPPVPPERLSRLLDELFDGAGLAADEPDQQRLAATMAALTPLTVIAGGPGTGKTTTVARVLGLLATISPTPPSIALAAPTGKAAARLEEAVRGALGDLGGGWPERVGTVRARTLHKLLGWLPGQRTRFRHDRDNPLPYDIVVVDELSMVSLTLMARLLEALRPQARVVLVGDPDQLTSVEAGAVLADITRAPLPVGEPLADRLAELAPPGRPAATPTSGQVVTLQHTWRFDGGIDTLARAIRAGDDEAALTVLRSSAQELSFTEADLGQPGADSLESLRRKAVSAGRGLHAAALAGDVDGALRALDQHRVLCAHRRGPFGVAHWERQVEQWLREALPGYGVEGDWYPGLPLMVTANDPDAGLYNGDTGVLVNTAHGLRAAFARGGEPMLFSTIQLDAVVPVHAMTVHKSQGSQFQALSLVLPPPESPLLTRELLYTAVTRASAHVEVIGQADSVRRAIQRPANRASGLGQRWS
ncbi:exodeoxyribonuclease V subunit alpha [Naumannella sp. ID2617S]|nr:exodeoxyribonuclease V subunit alpha [Naumannella sp. ID2617S]